MVARQLDLKFPKHGGKREGAGRKRAPRKRPGVPHRARAKHRARFPVHLTLRARAGLPSFRESALFAELRECIWNASRSPAVGEAFRILHFSIQPDHAHFIVEASDTDALTRGAQGLSIRLAKAINRTFGGIHGQVWADRYHARELKTPREVRHAIVYVLMNAKKHVRNFLAAIDVLSSAPWFDGVRGSVPMKERSPVVQPRTWLAHVGWRRRGLIEPHERPS
jgi:REP element-mobilizing transposase RayT